jgi:DUF4097 and DUF4098 domain-containing protein YvlB
MSQDSYIEMINKLREKTDARKAIWQKRDRDNEFSITFKTGTFVIDKWYDSSMESETYDFQIYNSDGDQIYTTGHITSSNLHFHSALRFLHDSVVRSYYKVDETMKGFSDQLDADDIVGDESAPQDLSETS